MPQYLGWAGLVDTHIAKFGDKLDLLLVHGNATTPMRRTIQVLAEQHQMEVGVEAPFFILLFYVWGLLVTYSWLEDIWRDCNICHVDIK